MHPFASVTVLRYFVGIVSAGGEYVVEVAPGILFHVSPPSVELCH